MAHERRIVKLSDSNKTTDYFPVSVTEAIYHKDSKGEVEVLSDVINDIRDDVGDASQSINDIINGTTTVPKATSATTAGSSTTAEKATKDSNDNTIDFSKDGIETLLDLTYSDDGTVTY